MKMIGHYRLNSFIALELHGTGEHQVNVDFIASMDYNRINNVPIWNIEFSSTVHKSKIPVFSIEIM